MDFGLIDTLKVLFMVVTESDTSKVQFVSNSYKHTLYLIADRLSATFPSYYRVRKRSPTVKGVIHTHTQSHVDKHIPSPTALCLSLSLWSPVCILVGWPAVTMFPFTHGDNVGFVRDAEMWPICARWPASR